MPPVPAFETTRLLGQSTSNASEDDEGWFRRMLSEQRNNGSFIDGSFIGDVRDNLNALVGQAPTNKVDDADFRNQVLASVDAMGGTATVGQFHVDPQANFDSIHNDDLPDSFLNNQEGTAVSMTPSQMGRKELYTEIPFVAVSGMQAKERAVTEAFLTYTAELDMDAAAAVDIHRTDSEKLLRAQQTTMIIEEELTQDASVVTMPLVVAVLAAAASQFIVGYNVAVMSAPEKFVFPGHSSQSWAVAVSSFAIGGPLGAVLGGSMADQKGRRGTLIIDMWLFFVGGLIQTFANSLTMITAGRFIVGIASGMSTVLVPVYLGELAPPKLRGMIGTLNQFAAVVGVLVADLLAFPFANSWGWRFAFALTIVVSSLQIMVAPYVLESPRWLLSKDSKSVTARYILKQLRGLRKDDEVENELATYMIGDSAQDNKKQSQSAVVSEMLREKPVRNLLFLCFALHVTQMFSGINGVFFYCGQIMQNFIENPLLGMTLVGTVNLISTYAAMFLMDRCSRKALLLWSSGGMFCSCCVIVVAQLGYLGNLYALVAVNTYVAFFEIGLGPIPWLYVAEVFDGKYVAAAMGLCSILNWICNFLIGLLFPTLTSSLGPYAFLPFAVVLAFGFLLTLVAIPGKSEEPGNAELPDTDELVEEMHKRNDTLITFEPNLMEAEEIENVWQQALDDRGT